MGPREELNLFITAYIEALTAFENDESDEAGRRPFSEKYTEHDFSHEAIADIVTDCTQFWLENRNTILAEGDESKYLMRRAGIDFYLTRNGHGAGFWDGDWPKGGEELTEAAKAYGTHGLMLGDDGKIYTHG